MAMSLCSTKGKGCVISFYKFSDPVDKDPSLIFYHLPKAPPPPASHQGVKIQTYEQMDKSKVFLREKESRLHPKCQSLCVLYPGQFDQTFKGI